MMIDGEDNIPRTFVPSLYLKIKLLKSFIIYITIYYSIKIIDEAYTNYW